ncbi:MAG: hypothetical protein WCX61_01440 [Candidatus Peribacteraceae bacterium]
MHSLDMSSDTPCDEFVLILTPEDVAQHIRDAENPSDNNGLYETLMNEIRSVHEQARPALFELLRQRTIAGPR